MKTAEELVYEIECFIPTDKAADMIKAYGRQCAEQALKDAAEKATLLYESDATGKISHYGCTYGTEKGEVRVDRESITSTPILTP